MNILFSLCSGICRHLCSCGTGITRSTNLSTGQGTSWRSVTTTSYGRSHAHAVCGNRHFWLENVIQKSSSLSTKKKPIHETGSEDESGDGKLACDWLLHSSLDNFLDRVGNFCDVVAVVRLWDGHGDARELLARSWGWDGRSWQREKLAGSSFPIPGFFKWKRLPEAQKK